MNFTPGLGVCMVVAAGTSCGRERPAAPTQLASVAVPRAVKTPDDVFGLVANQFYHGHPDAYDHLVIFPTRGVSLIKPFYLAAEFSPPHGVNLRPTTAATEPSEGRLRGVISMGHGWLAETSAVSPSEGLFRALDVLAHETAHEWRWESATKPTNHALSGDGAHWRFYVDSGGSPMGGNDWQSAGDSMFVATPVKRIQYGQLDLWRMGLIPATPAPRVRRLVDPQPLCTNCVHGHRTKRHVRVRAAHEWLTVTGAPTHTRSRPAADARTLTQAWLIAVPEGGTPSSEEMAYILRLKQAWQHLFARATNGAGSVTVTLHEQSAVQASPRQGLVP